MSTATTALECMESASLPNEGETDPVITPDHFSGSPSNSTKSVSVGSSGFAGAATESDGSHEGGDNSNAIANSMALSSNAERSLVHCKQLEGQEPRALARSASAFEGRRQGGVQFRPMEELQPEPSPARLGQRVGEKTRAGIVEIGHRHEIDARAVRLPGDGTPDALDLRRRSRGHAAGQENGTADHARRDHRGVALPCRRRALELHDILQCELVERRTVALALEKVEEREPCEHRQLGVDVAFDALFELPAGIHRLAVGEPERGVFQHGAQPGIRLRDLDRGLRRRPLDETRAGHGHIAARRFDMAARTLASGVRSELARGDHARTDIGLECLGLFLGRWFRKERHFCPGTSIRDRESAIPAASAPDAGALPNGNSLALSPTLIMFPS